MIRKVDIVIAVAALLLSALLGVRLSRQASLPRTKLLGGGEFQVFKVCYGGPDDHRLGGSPKQVIWAWNRLPPQLQRLIPAPHPGDSALLPSSNRIALSIYWAWIDPSTHKAALGPSGEVLMTTDSGGQTNLGWPSPFGDRTGGGYRQIFVGEPPRNSAKLHFRVPVEVETVEVSRL